MKGRPTPKRRTSRLLELAKWATYSPRSSLLGKVAHEGQLRSPGYRGNRGVTVGATPAPRYAKTSRSSAKKRRRRAHTKHLQNVTLRSTTVMANEAGVELATEVVDRKPKFYKHPEWGLIRLSPYVTQAQRERDDRRLERQVERVLSDPVAAERVRSALGRLSRVLRPDFLGSGRIRTTGAK